MTSVRAPALAPGEKAALDAISYDKQGRVVFSGRAQPGGAVRLYLDDKLVAEARSGDDSAWRVIGDERIAPGDYRLRVDEVDAKGKVESRVESPFRREAITAEELGPDMLTVQRGDNLWRIAESLYGDGIRYSVIYKANAGAIRDPDLIYPGQVFSIPKPQPGGE